MPVPSVFMKHEYSWRVVQEPIKFVQLLTRTTSLVYICLQPPSMRAMLFPIPITLIFETTAPFQAAIIQEHLVLRVFVVVFVRNPLYDALESCGEIVLPGVDIVVNVKTLIQLNAVALRIELNRFAVIV